MTEPADLRPARRRSARRSAPAARPPRTPAAARPSPRPRGSRSTRAGSRRRSAAPSTCTRREADRDVQVRYGETGDLAATLIEEGDNSPADVFFAQEPGAIGAVAERGPAGGAAAGHPRPGAAAVPRPGGPLGRRHRPRPGHRLRRRRRRSPSCPTRRSASPTRGGTGASAGRPATRLAAAVRDRAAAASTATTSPREWLEGHGRQRRPGLPRQRLDPRRDRQRRDRRRPDQPLLRRPGRRRRGPRLPGQGLLPAGGPRLAAAADQRRRARVVRPQGGGVRLRPHRCSPTRARSSSPRARRSTRSPRASPAGPVARGAAVGDPALARATSPTSARPRRRSS